MELVRIGSRNSAVELLQMALHRAGLNPGVIDGIFGERTLQSVLDFQRRNGLAADGIVGNMTWGRLNPYLTGYITHRIERGDTFWSLAQKYNTTIQSIMTANPNVTPENLVINNNIVIPLNFEVVPTNMNFTYRLLQFCIEGIKVRYPFIQTSVIGNSVQGKALYMLRMGEGQNRVLYNAAHHANEWITTPVLMKYIEQFSAAYSQNRNIFDTNAREIYDNTSIYIVPMVNPDGVDLVTGAVAPGSAVYENARAMNYLHLPFPSGWKANIRGVDLNLQYPAGWEIAREIKMSQGYTSPGPRDYVGEAPLTEPESYAMAEITRTLNPSLILAYHTQGEIIYWRYLDYLPPNSYEIVRLLSQVSGYRYEDTPLASGHAGYKDWFILKYNRPGYTIECGRGANPLHINQFDQIYRDNIGILTKATLDFR